MNKALLPFCGLGTVKNPTHLNYSSERHSEIYKFERLSALNLKDPIKFYIPLSQTRHPPPPKENPHFSRVVVGYFFFWLKHPFRGETCECSLAAAVLQAPAVLFFEAAKVVGSETLGLSQRLLKHREQFLGSPNKMHVGAGGGWSQRLEGNT